VEDPAYVVEELFLLSVAHMLLEENVADIAVATEVEAEASHLINHF
jgi:hypothetical protein